MASLGQALHGLHARHLADGSLHPHDVHPDTGESLTVHLLVRNGYKLRLRGKVVRSFCVPSNLRHFVASGFGVRLDDAPEEYFQLLANLLRVPLANAG